MCTMGTHDTGTQDTHPFVSRTHRIRARVSAWSLWSARGRGPAGDPARVHTRLSPPRRRAWDLYTTLELVTVSQTTTSAHNYLIYNGHIKQNVILYNM